MKSKVLKKSVIFLLLCALLLSVFQSAITVFASTTTITVDRIKYELDKSDMTAMVIDAKNISGHVVIPSEVSGYTVSAIDYNAFEGNKVVSKVTLPPTITGIGDEAFSGCTGLQSINIPDNLTYLGAYAFYNCTNLTSIYVPGSVRTINYGAFENCFSLNRVMLGSGITCIDCDAFNSTGIRSIYIPSSVYIIENCAFYDCYYSLESNGTVYYQGSEQEWNSIYIEEGSDGPNNQNEAIVEARKRYNVKMTDDCFYYSYNKDSNSVNIVSYFGDKSSVIVPDTIEDLSVTSFSSSAFVDNYNIVDVTIPETVTTVSSSCFQNCQYLENVNFSTKTEKISNNAFYGCLKYKNINLPNTITSIGNNAFTDTACYKLNAKWIDSCLYIENYLIKAKADAIRINVRLGTKVIADNAFDDCTDLIHVKMTSSVKYIGAYAFKNCKKLQSIVVPSTLKKIDEYAFSTTESLKFVYTQGTPQDFYNISYDDVTNSYFKSASFNYYTSILNNTFYFNSTASYVSIVNYDGKDVHLDIPEYYSIPESVISVIEPYAFAYNTTLVSVSLPSSIENIKDYSFASCSSLESVIIDKNVKSIASTAFNNCENLATVYYTGKQSEWDALNFTFATNTKVICNYNTSLEGFEFTIDESKGTIEITGYTGYESNISIPAEFNGYAIKSIANNAFKNNTQLTDITIDGTDLEIGDNAFYGCSSLENVVIKDGVYCIWANAFENCTSLKNVGLTNKISFITYKAFYGCDNISTVLFNGTYNEWETVTEEIDRGNDTLLDANKYFVADMDNATLMLQDDNSSGSIALNDTPLEIYGAKFEQTISFSVDFENSENAFVIVPIDFENTELIKAFEIINGNAEQVNIRFFCRYALVEATAPGVYAICEMIGTPGDINTDKSINSLDSNLLRRYISGEYFNNQMYLLDVNGDNSVNSIDSNLLKRAVAGK